MAHAAALGGYRTILEDLLPNALRKAETEIRANLDQAVELGKVDAADADAAFAASNMRVLSIEAAREADLVIEAVPEEMESKIEIFTMLDKVCRPTTILASNTSSLSITEIASVTDRAKKCVGMHSFNPVHKMKLLEIVRALETDDDTLAAAVEVGKCRGSGQRMARKWRRSSLDRNIRCGRLHWSIWSGSTPACTFSHTCTNLSAKKKFAPVRCWCNM
jgi:3-hydroxybutyryl-CoA dehydrogenase